LLVAASAGKLGFHSFLYTDYLLQLPQENKTRFHSFLKINKTRFHFANRVRYFYGLSLSLSTQNRMSDGTEMSI
jgi:hypothetical protein